MTTAEALRAARAEMEKRGYCRGTCEDDKGRVCALGAFGKAAGDSDPFTWWNGACYLLLLAMTGAARGAVSEENDARGSVQVLAAFEDAAQIAESAELTDAHWPEPSASPTPPLSSPGVATAPAGSPACPPTVATLGALGGEGGGT